MKYPNLFRIRQTFPRPKVDDVAAEVAAQLASLPCNVKAGESIALTAGSRGIASIPQILRVSADFFKSLGAKPFIVPAMGSHGGATAEGQKQVLKTYGINEDACGCPIRSSMETDIIATSPEGIPVHFDRMAREADHVLVVNRIKPHTYFAGDIESGLMKMMLIGLGKHEGARVYHRAVQDFSFGQILRSVAQQVFDNCPILAGLGIVENAYKETAVIEAILPENFESRERDLLRKAREWMPRLPFEKVDVLLIDEIGKNISGPGMDTNIVGRKFNDHKAVEGETPKVKRIAVRRLTPETHGNALGVGLADFCTTKLVQQADRQATEINGITSQHLSAARFPLAYNTDKAMLDQALSTIGLAAPHEARALWIKNTLEITEMECSEAYLEEAKSRDDLEIVEEPRPWPFDGNGNLP